MRGPLSIFLALALLAFIAAHVALIVGISRVQNRSRAALAFFVPPLAPFWGHELGMTKRANAWLGALALYIVLLVALS
jgi:hypothetical protein